MFAVVAVSPWSTYQVLLRLSRPCKGFRPLTVERCFTKSACTVCDARLPANTTPSLQDSCVARSERLSVLCEAPSCRDKTCALGVTVCPVPKRLERCAHCYRMPDFGRSEREHEHKGYFQFRTQALLLPIKSMFQHHFSAVARIAFDSVGQGGHSRRRRRRRRRGVCRTRPTSFRAVGGTKSPLRRPRGGTFARPRRRRGRCRAVADGQCDTEGTLGGGAAARGARKRGAATHGVVGGGAGQAGVNPCPSVCVGGGKLWARRGPAERKTELYVRAGGRGGCQEG